MWEVKILTKTVKMEGENLIVEYFDCWKLQMEYKDCLHECKTTESQCQKKSNHGKIQ